MSNIVIVGAARTAVGAFMGSLATVPAHTLGAAAIGAAHVMSAGHVDALRLCTRCAAATSPMVTSAAVRPGTWSVAHIKAVAVAAVAGATIAWTPEVRHSANASESAARRGSEA